MPARPTRNQPDAGGQAGLTSQLRFCSHERAQDPKIVAVLTQMNAHRLWTNVAARFVRQLREDRLSIETRNLQYLKVSKDTANSQIDCPWFVLLDISVRRHRRGCRFSRILGAASPYDRRLGTAPAVWVLRCELRRPVVHAAVAREWLWDASGGGSL